MGGCSESHEPSMQREGYAPPHHLYDNVGGTRLGYDLAGQVPTAPDWNYSQRDFHAMWSARFQPRHCDHRPSAGLVAEDVQPDNERTGGFYHLSRYSTSPRQQVMGSTAHEG